MAKYFQIPKGPIEFLSWLLEFSGQLRTERFSPLNRLMTILGGVFTANACLGPLLCAITYDADSQERGEMILYAVSGFYICTKFYNCVLRRKDVREILKLMHSLWETRLDGNCLEIKRRSAERCRSTVVKLFSILNSLVVLMVLKGIVINVGKSPEERKVPFPCWFPLSDKKWFLTNCIWETLTMSFEMYSVSVHYSFLCTIIIQASAEMDILSARLESGDINVKEAVKHHIKIIRLVKYLNKIHSGQMALEIFFYGLQVAAAGYTVMKLLHSHAGLGQLGFSLYVLFLYISFSYLLCLGGHEITTQSEKVYSSIYQTRWYELSVEEQKSLGLMLYVASKNLQIRYKGLVTFSMERYAQMIQATYSYLTVLSGMDL